MTDTLDDTAGISIVTTTYNNFVERGGSLPLFVEAIENQRVSDDVELLIVDDGSTDRTATLVDELDGRTLDNDVRIRVRRTEHTGNRAAGRNVGLAAARHDAVVFLDADTLPLRADCLSTAVESTPIEGFACGARCFWSPPEWEPAEVKRLIESETVGDINEWAHLPKNSMNRTDGSRALQEYALIGQFGVASKDVFESVGGFDESFEAWGYESRDLMTRLLLETREFCALGPACTVIHLNHPLDIPGGAAETNRDLYESKLERAGIAFDVYELLSSTGGIHEGVLTVSDSSVDERIAVTRPGDTSDCSPASDTEPKSYTVKQRGEPVERVPLSDTERTEGRMSVIVSTADNFSDRNGSLALVLRALENQRSTDVEVVIVDDGSVDATREFITDYRDTSPLDVRLVRFEENSGNRSKARNRGVEAASGELLLFIDDDTVPLSDTMLRRLRQLYTPGAYLCGAKRRWTDTDWARATYERRIRDGDSEWLREHSWVPKGISRRRGRRSLWEVTHLTNFGLVSKRDFLDVSGFDEDAFSQWGREDIDLMARLYISGCSFVNLYEHLSVLHLNHPLKAADRESRESAFHEYTRKEREEYGYEFDLESLYGVVTGNDNRVLRPVSD